MARKILSFGAAVVLAVALLMVFAGSPTIAAPRVALVYGNSNYANAPNLANPANDAALMTTSLESVGFEVITVIDASQAQMRKGLSDFGRMAQDADIALFFYAGHGLQVAGRNWLIPVDADIVVSTDLPAQSISANTVLESMELSGARARIVVLDACRNNPLTRSLTRANTKGLAKIDSSAAGSMIIFATGPGEVALDGTGANSPFSKALAEQIVVPGIEIRQMMGRVRADVMAQTGDQQVPWVNEALVGEIYLASAPVEDSAAATQQTAAQAAVNLLPTINASKTVVEIEFWNSIRDTGDEAMLQLYVNKYPVGVFIDIAKAKIEKLKLPPQQPQQPLGQSLTRKADERVSNADEQVASLQNRSLLQERDMENAAINLINDFQNLSSAQAGQLLAGLPRYYGDQVDYYGKRQGRRLIRRDKEKFTRRWPQRYYQMPNAEMRVSCFPSANYCVVEGVMEWQVRSNQRNASANGYSSMRYEVEFFRSGPRIVAEDGKVLRRQ